MTASGFANVFRAPNVVEVAARLGYPVYIASILGVWKLLGALAIGTADFHKMPRLREWAYAGFFFDLSGAIISHVASNDTIASSVPAAALSPKRKPAPTGESDSPKAATTSSESLKVEAVS